MHSANQKYRLTVIMPAKGVCQGLEVSAKSILQQNVDVEWIIVKPKNDPQTDLALKVLNPDPRLKIITEQTSGLYEAMNDALLTASGKYIVFFGVGDFWVASNAAAHAVQALDESCAQWGLGSWYFLSEDELLICPPTNEPIFRHEVFLSSTPLCHQTVIASKEALVRVGGFDTGLKVAADRLLIFNLWLNSNPLIWDFATVAYKTGGFSAIHQELALAELQNLQSSLGDHKPSRLFETFRNLWQRFSLGRRPVGKELPIFFDWLPESISLCMMKE
jgi:hypothetical protein